MAQTRPELATAVDGVRNHGIGWIGQDDASRRNAGEPLYTEYSVGCSDPRSSANNSLQLNLAQALLVLVLIPRARPRHSVSCQEGYK